MAISYLSKPLVSTVKPFEENVGLIAQVAQQKQNKYDQLLTAIFQKENDLLAIDTKWASQEITDRKNALLKKADEDLTSMTSLDLMNPENIKRVESIFDPITDDRGIITGARRTKEVNEQLETYDYWKKKKPELYNPSNESFTLEEAAKNINLSEKDYIEAGYQPQAIEYVKEEVIDDALKKLEPDVTTTILPDGGFIFTRKNEFLSKDRIIAQIPTDDKIMKQMMVNAHYAYRSVSDDQLLNAKKGAIESSIQDHNSVIKVIDDNTSQLTNTIQQIKANDPDAMRAMYVAGYTKPADYIQSLQAKVDNNKTQTANYATSRTKLQNDLTSFNEAYTVDGKYRKLDYRERTDIGTNVYFNVLTDRKIKAFAYNKETIEVKDDPYTLNNIKFEQEKQLKFLQAELDALKDKGGKGISSSSSSATGGEAEGFEAGPIYQPGEKSLLKEDEENKYTPEKVKVKVDQWTKSLSLSGNPFSDPLARDGELFNNFVQQELSAQGINVAKNSPEFAQRKKDFDFQVQQFAKNMETYNTTKPNPDATVDGNPGTETWRSYMQRNQKYDEYLKEVSQTKANLNSLLETSALIKKNALTKAIGQVGEGGVEIKVKSKKTVGDKVFGVDLPVTIPKEYLEKIYDGKLTKDDEQDLLALNGFANSSKKYSGTNAPKFILPNNDIGQMTDFLKTIKNPTALIGDLPSRVNDIYTSELKELNIVELGSPVIFTDYSGEKSPAKPYNERAKNYAFNALASEDRTADVDKENIKIVGFNPDFTNGGYKMKVQYLKKIAGVSSTNVQDISLSPEAIKELKLPIETQDAYVNKILESKKAYYINNKLTQNVALYNLDLYGKTYTFARFTNGETKIGIKRADGTIDYNALMTTTNGSIPSVQAGLDLIYGTSRNAQSDLESIAKRYDIKIK